MREFCFTVIPTAGWLLRNPPVDSLDEAGTAYDFWEHLACIFQKNTCDFQEGSLRVCGRSIDCVS